MNTTQRLTGLALAMLLTVTILTGIDRLAHTPVDTSFAAQTTTATTAKA
ncbi:MAG: hypothetical protein KIS83_03345 [Rubrivivax sp.]|nr:hypothetical protein [Rubrivivax sp.]MCW5609715.1 hypothetical protein [Rubrivivax sp.]